MAHRPWTRRLQRLLAFAGLGWGLAAAAGAQVILYEHDDYQGRSYASDGEQRDLSRVGFNDKASSVVVRQGNWQLCDDAEFRGQCITLNPGRYPSLRELGMNDRLSSVRPLGGAGWGGGWGGGGPAVELFEHHDYGGRSLPTSGSADLTREGFNDKASSIIVRQGRWDFCADADYGGRCITLGPGGYASLRALGMNDQLSSVRQADGRGGWNGHGRDPAWSGDDGSAPQVLLMPNGSGRVTFDNGCLVFYGRDGDRLQNLPACHGRQLPRADAAVAARRAEQGLAGARGRDEHPWARPGRGDADAPPEVLVGSNREGEVIFRNNCIAWYTAQGRRYQQQPNCDAGQLQRADAAMAAYLREQNIR